METIQSNIQELRKILNEENFKKDEALEFLDAIEENASDLDIEIDDLKSEVKEKNEEMRELESGLDSVEFDSVINCGIGEINYRTPDNILLQDLCENLDTAIQKHTPKKVNQILSSIV